MLRILWTDAGEPTAKRMRLLSMADCPIRRLWCLYIFPCINSSVAMRVKYPNFIGSIKVPASLQRKLTCVCIGHLSNVKQLGVGGPARIHSITVCGSLHMYAPSMPISCDIDLGQHGVKDVEYLSYKGYGNISCYKNYSYGLQTVVSTHAHELQHLHRRDSKMWCFDLDTVAASYPRTYLDDVNPRDPLPTHVYGEQL